MVFLLRFSSFRAYSSSIEDRAVVSKVSTWSVLDHRSIVSAADILTAIETLEFVAGLLRVDHSVEEGADASIVFAPKVVGNCIDITVSTVCSVWARVRGAGH